MILTALNNYYDRLSDQGIEGLPPYGYSNESISYCLQIDTEGNLIDVIPLLDTSGKKPRPSVRMVPNPPKRASNISPCFLWDKTSYVLGLTASDKEKDLARAKQTHQAFKEYHQPCLHLQDSTFLGSIKSLLFPHLQNLPAIVDDIL